MTNTKDTAISIQPLRNADLDTVTGGENTVNGHVGFEFEPTTKAKPWNPETGHHKRPPLQR